METAIQLNHMALLCRQCSSPGLKECVVQIHSASRKLCIVTEILTCCQKKNDSMSMVLWTLPTLYVVLLFVGGVVTASCHHGVVYGFKVLLRGESVRDHVDLLLSLKHLPNLVVNDMPGMTAKHGNHRQANMFKPFEGRFADPCEENLRMLNDRTFEVSIDLFATSGHHSSTDHTNSAEPVHPVTGSSDTYCATDQFHLKNIKTEVDKLRNLKLVRELRGRLNSQVEEQLFSHFHKNAYFLNSMTPYKFMFTLRLLLHLRNVKLVAQQLLSAKHLLHSSGLSISYGSDGRLADCNDDGAAADLVSSTSTQVNSQEVCTDTPVLHMECDTEPPTPAQLDAGSQQASDIKQHNLRPLPKKVCCSW